MHPTIPSNPFMLNALEMFVKSTSGHFIMSSINLCEELHGVISTSKTSRISMIKAINNTRDLLLNTREQSAAAPMKVSLPGPPSK